MSSMVTRPGFPYLFAVLVTLGCEGLCSSSFLQGHPPSLRFGHPDVTTDDTAPPHARTRLERGVAIPSGSDIRVPSRVLSAAKQGEGGAPERVGSLQERRKGIAYPPTPACRNEDDNCLSVRKSIQGSEPSGPPPARTYPSRPAHPEEHAGRRHRSSPRRARVRRLHAHRWRLRG